MTGPTLDDLVANRTMSAEICATLRDAVTDRRSFLVFAKPRLAGKTTVQEAMLAQAPSGTPIRTVGVDGEDIDALAAGAKGGYLVIPEIAQDSTMPGYIWGEPVRRAFSARGCALSVVLHADGVEEALGIVRANGVPDADVQRLELLIHLRALGDDWQAPTRRVVAQVHAGGAIPRLLYRWDEPADRWARVVH